MKALDFEYDGLRLSDFGFMICSFDSKNSDTVSNGSQIKFNTSPILHGAKHLLTNSEYDECIETTFAICKNPCTTESNDIEAISVDDMRDIMRWLNRKDFHKFKLLQDGYENIYFDGSFNVNNIIRNGDVVGFELNLKTNRPFALHEPITFNFEITSNNEKRKINDISDEIGFIYFDAEIICNADGDLIIHNDIEDRQLIIKNCKNGEIIKLNQPIITTSISSHKIQNDFNFNFLRIANTFNQRINCLTFSIPCSVKLTYTPIRKVGI